MKKKLNKEALWAEKVVEAKNLLGIKEARQMEIAIIALDICEITWGGGRSRHDELFTLKRFAHEININPKTLSNWIAVKKLVYDKIPQKIRNEVTFTFMAQIAKSINKDSSPAKVSKMISKFIDQSSVDVKLLGYLGVVKSILYNLEERSGSITCGKDTLEEILYYAIELKKAILRENKKLRPYDHGLISIYSKHNKVSAARALGIPRNVKITVKDQKVINWMKKNAGFRGPTEIGIKAGKHNRNNASAWAVRSLFKLKSVGLVERDVRGKYQLTRKAKKF